MNNKITFKNLILLNILFLIYSFTGILSKKASLNEYFSLEFMKYFIGSILIMAIYSVMWQLTLQKIPLSIAYSNKAVVIIWGLVWSVIFFNEALRLSIIIGGCLIIAGILLVVSGYE